MSDSEGQMIPLLPLAAKTLRLQPGEITPAIEDSPYVVHFTMAALDTLNPADKEQTPSTLRIIRISEQSSDEDEDEDEAEAEDDEDTEPVTLLTLSPSTQFQQRLDLYVAPTEGICFEVIGSYPIHVTGNIVDHPLTEELLAAEEDEEDSEEDSEEESEEEDSDEDSGEEAEVMELDSEGSSSSDELDEVEEAGPERIQEVKEAKEAKEPKAAAKGKKRESEAEAEAEAEPKKKVKFSSALEKGPEATESKYPTKKLEGGIVIEDRKLGDGPSAKKGSKVSMRYVGKLANGKVFDKNTGGKPFTFALGRGEVIKGWDVGIHGIKAGGERRIVIPAPMAYGKQSLPGIPKNSELRFDVKCISIK